MIDKSCKIVVFFIIFFARTLYADFISELDREQREIQKDFYKLKNELLSPELLKIAIADKKSILVVSQI